jgi:hypothetical protein
VILPAISGSHVFEDGHPVDAQAEAGSYVIRVGSGTYEFQVSH